MRAQYQRSPLGTRSILSKNGSFNEGGPGGSPFSFRPAGDDGGNREHTAMKMLAFTLLFFLVAAIAQPPKVSAFTLYVSPHGRDTWSGQFAQPQANRADGPLATLLGARDRIRVLRNQGKLSGASVMVLVRGGTYFLTEPLIFRPEDSGTADVSVMYAAFPGEHPVFSGGQAITGWHVAEHGLWVAAVARVGKTPWEFRQLFVRDARRPRTVLPLEGYYMIADAAPPSEPSKPADGFHYTGSEINANWRNLRDVDLLCYQIWSMARMRVKSLDETAHLVRFTGATVSTDYWASLPKGNRYRVENVVEALPDEPGAWYLDRAASLVYYHPLPGEQITSFAPVAPRLTQLVRFEGDPDGGKWVSHLNLRGLAFQDADWTMGLQGRSAAQAEVDLPAVITGVGARDCRLENCEIAHIGTYAVEWGKGCRGNVLTGCRLHDLGAGGVKIGEFTPNVAEEMVAQGNVVSHCRIYDGGQVHPAAVGVWIGQSPGNQIVYNDIHDFYYTAVSVGWTWGYGPALAQNTLIAYNHIYNIGRGVLSDMGGIYTLGNQHGSVLSHNLIHNVQSFDYGGWGIYPDEGTADLTVRDNIVYGCKSAGLHQHYGKNNVIENNIFADNQEAQLARTRAEDHLSFTFARNIVYWTQGTLLNGNWSGGQVAMDDNVYWKAGGEPVTFENKSLADWQKTGHDLHSSVADPLFADPSAHDFLLRPGSPARGLGFQPIDLTGVGAGG